MGPSSGGKALLWTFGMAGGLFLAGLEHALLVFLSLPALWLWGCLVLLTLGGWFRIPSVSFSAWVSEGHGYHYCLPFFWGFGVGMTGCSPFLVLLSIFYKSLSTVEHRHSTEHQCLFTFEQTRYCMCAGLINRTRVCLYAYCRVAKVPM